MVNNEDVADGEDVTLWEDDMIDEEGCISADEE